MANLIIYEADNMIKELWVEDPESMDPPQAIWFSAPTPGMEADALLDIEKAGFYIRDLESARRALEYLGWSGENLKKVHFV